MEEQSRASLDDEIAAIVFLLLVRPLFQWKKDRIAMSWTTLFGHMFFMQIQKISTRTLSVVTRSRQKLKKQ